MQQVMIYTKSNYPFTELYRRLENRFASIASFEVAINADENGQREYYVHISKGNVNEDPAAVLVDVCDAELVALSKDDPENYKTIIASMGTDVSPYFISIHSRFNEDSDNIKSDIISLIKTLGDVLVVSL